MSTWTFGLEPLPQATELAPLVRHAIGLVLALDGDDEAVARLIAAIGSVADDLAGRASVDTTPRLGENAPPEGRPYLDHSRDIGAYNPCFPEYAIVVDGDQAAGAVTFPLAYEGPPGVVHGGLLATFFDCVIQHHNCDLGEAGKTTSLHVDYRRPTPVQERLAFAIERRSDHRRITSHAQLTFDRAVVCTATIEAVAGDRSRLPVVPPRPVR